ncbi:hypothetical protein MSPP1_000685 [Malassezia sp. CBS 17886]|nr:hypothetical protein MSPP1_000685 [Malassezia sp. CBS 17886]
MDLQTPLFRAAQDDAHVFVTVGCAGAQAHAARIVAQECTFGCYAPPLYLPLTLPLPVHALDVSISLSADAEDAHATYRAATKELRVSLAKASPGQHFPGLDAMRPQILSDTQMAAFERDAARGAAAAGADGATDHAGAGGSRESAGGGGPADGDAGGGPTDEDAGGAAVHGGTGSAHGAPHDAAGPSPACPPAPLPGLVPRSTTEFPRVPAVFASGRIPYLEVANPAFLSPAERTAAAERAEDAQWDEGMYLDSFVDADGEVAALLAPESAWPASGTTAVDGAPGDAAPSARDGLALLVQILFAHMYEARVSMGDPSPESAWTICKLCRSLVCFAPPTSASGGDALSDREVLDVLRASYRRALTFPLYRSWALCDRVRLDVARILMDKDAKVHVLQALACIDSIFALAPEGTGLSESTETVLHMLWELWMSPLQRWVQKYATDADLQLLGEQVVTAVPLREAVADWDLAALDEMARDALASGEAERKRPPEDTSGSRPAQQACHDMHALYTFECQRTIGCVSGLVRIRGDVQGGELVCTVSPAGRSQNAHARTSLVLALPQCRPVVVDTPWDITPGRYSAAAHAAFRLRLPLQVRRPVRPTMSVPQSPWLHAPAGFSALACAVCAACLAHVPTPPEFRALPSENWEELVDAWMCHADQKLNTSVTQGRDGVDPMRVPQPHEVWIGTLTLKISSALLLRDAVVSAPEVTGYGERHGYPFSCAHCGTDVGWAATDMGRAAVAAGAAATCSDPPPRADAAPCAVQLLQFAVLPAGMPPQGAPWDVHDTLGVVLSNYLVAQADRHAMHYFAMEGAADDVLRAGPPNAHDPPAPPLLLWLFQPSIELLRTGESVRPACKVLYRSAAGLPPPSYIPLTLPRVYAGMLEELLARSSVDFGGPEQAVMGDWCIGWLPRSEQ